MARGPRSQPFTGTLSRLARELRLPDPEGVMEHHFRNLEALGASARVAASGAAAAMSRQREMLREALDNVGAEGRGGRPAGSRTLFPGQAGLARGPLDLALKNGGEIADLLRQSGRESLEILRKRFREGLDELRSGYRKPR